MDEIVVALRNENASLRERIHELEEILEQQRLQYNVYELSRFEKFLHLPPELREYILGFLDFDTLEICKSVSRAMSAHVSSIKGKIPLTITLRKLRVAALYELEVIMANRPVLSYEICDREALENIDKKDFSSGEPCECSGVFMRGERFGGREMRDGERTYARHMRFKTRRCYTHDPIQSIHQHLNRFLSNSLFKVHLIFGRPDLAENRQMVQLCFTNTELDLLIGILGNEPPLCEINTLDIRTVEAQEVMWKMAEILDARRLVSRVTSLNISTYGRLDWTNGNYMVNSPKLAEIECCLGHLCEETINRALKDWQNGSRSISSFMFSGRFRCDWSRLTGDLEIRLLKSTDILFIFEITSHRGGVLQCSLFSERSDDLDKMTYKLEISDER